MNHYTTTNSQYGRYWSPYASVYSPVSSSRTYAPSRASESRSTERNDEDNDPTYLLKKEFSEVNARFVAKQDKPVIHIPEDGNCLFRCFAAAVEGDQTKHMAVRARAVECMRENGDAFRPFVADSSPSLEEYLEELGKEGVWGGEPEITAMAQVFGVTVSVFDGDTAKRISVYNEGNPEEVVLVKSGSHYNLALTAPFQAANADKEYEAWASRVQAQYSSDARLSKTLQEVYDDRDTRPTASSFASSSSVLRRTGGLSSSGGLSDHYGGRHSLFDYDSDRSHAGYSTSARPSSPTRASAARPSSPSTGIPIRDGSRLASLSHTRAPAGASYARTSSYPISSFPSSYNYPARVPISGASSAYARPMFSSSRPAGVHSPHYYPRFYR